MEPEKTPGMYTTGKTEIKNPCQASSFFITFLCPGENLQLPPCKSFVLFQSYFLRNFLISFDLASLIFFCSDLDSLDGHIKLADDEEVLNMTLESDDDDSGGETRRLLLYGIAGKKTAVQGVETKATLYFIP